MITLKLRQLINDFTECNNFEIKIKDNKVTLYYYDKIKNFSTSNVAIITKNKLITIHGNNLVIEQMFLEYVTVKGEILKLEFSNNE